LAVEPLWVHLDGTTKLARGWDSRAAAKRRRGVSESPARLFAWGYVLREDSAKARALYACVPACTSLVSPVERVYCPNMSSRHASAPAEPEKLRPVLHEKIERMNGEQLMLLNRVLVQLEAEQVADRLSEAFDADQAQGKLRRVAELVRQFRAEHRYA